MNKQFLDNFMNAVVNDGYTYVDPARIQPAIVDTLSERIIERGKVGGTYTYTELVQGINFGSESEPYYIYADTWANGDSRALIGVYLFLVDQRHLEDAGCLLGMLVVSQSKDANFEPSKIVRSWLFGLGAFTPNTDDQWLVFTVQQMNAAHKYCKGLN